MRYLHCFALATAVGLSGIGCVSSSGDQEIGVPFDLGPADWSGNHPRYDFSADDYAGINFIHDANVPAFDGLGDGASGARDFAVGRDFQGPRDFSVQVNNPPCVRDVGFAAFRFHFAANSGINPILDAFGLPDNSNWQALAAPNASFVDAVNGGGLELSQGNPLVIHYSVAGLTQINKATLWVLGRSYSVLSHGSFEAATPIYGSDIAIADSVSNAAVYQWSSLDFTSFLMIGDNSNLTSIKLYARATSNDLVINTVELCIDGF